MDGSPARADVAFLEALHRLGILLDAGAPDPVHSFRGVAGASRSLTLYPSGGCDLRCVYCHATSGSPAGRRLPAGHAAVAVDDFFASLAPGAQRVALSFHGGGEPTTNLAVMEASWERFRGHAAERGLRAAALVITNGAFGPAARRTLQQPGWQVEVSYDGPLQGRQRPTASGRDSRSRVVSNLRALRDAGTLMRIRATITRDGLSALRALVDDAVEVGIRRVQVEPVSPAGRGEGLPDGPPEPEAFAEAFLDALGHALRRGVELVTAAWSHTRVGDGLYCAALAGARALTPDGFVSACSETCDGHDPADPFLVGRLDAARGRVEIWPEREALLRRRVGYDLPGCQACFLVDTCAGGCAARARTLGGDPFRRNELHCATALRVNARLLADLADGRLLPDAGWQPVEARLDPSESALPGVWGRVVALVPPFALGRWNADPDRRPFLPVPRDAPRFFHLPAGSG